MSDEQNERQAEKARLLARRDELRDRIDSINSDFRQGLDADSEERAIQLENYEVLQGIANAAADELRQIEARLALLAD